MRRQRASPAVARPVEHVLQRAFLSQAPEIGVRLGLLPPALLVLLCVKEVAKVLRRDEAGACEKLRGKRGPSQGCATLYDRKR